MGPRPHRKSQSAAGKRRLLKLKKTVGIGCSRPGGSWRFIMHAADRTNHKNEIVFLEVLEPERIIFQYPDPVHNFLPTMVFAEEGGKIRLT
jgi:Activator of Hsp90 ATPase homolog 1-like protein